MPSGTHHMDKASASNIQSSQAKAGHDVGVGSFAARAQSAADRNTNTAASSGTSGTGSGFSAGSSGQASGMASRGGSKK